MHIHVVNAVNGGGGQPYQCLDTKKVSMQQIQPTQQIHGDQFALWDNLLYGDLFAHKHSCGIPSQLVITNCMYQFAAWLKFSAYGQIHCMLQIYCMATFFALEPQAGFNVRY